jgi:hypothetical protein
VKVNYNLTGKKKYTLYFRDSLLILPSSLKKLGEAFESDVRKSIYPYKFVNDESISLSYEGAVPSFNFFDNVEPSEYKKYCDEIENSI